MSDAKMTLEEALAIYRKGTPPPMQSLLHAEYRDAKMFLRGYYAALSGNPGESESDRETREKDQEIYSLKCRLAERDESAGVTGAKLLRAQEENASLRLAGQGLFDALQDVLNHGLEYESGEIHQADIPKAKEALAKYTSTREGLPRKEKP